MGLVYWKLEQKIFLAEVYYGFGWMILFLRINPSMLFVENQERSFPNVSVFTMFDRLLFMLIP
jgi:hypothetical protein